MLELTLFDPRGVLPTRQRFFSQLFGPAILRGLEEEDRLMRPRVEITETDDAYTVEAELPGFAKEEIELEVEGDRLRLRAERKEEKEEEKDNYIVKEREHGTYVRTFILPEDVAADKIEANMDKGILKVTLPKAEETKPKRIEVKVN